MKATRCNDGVMKLTHEANSFATATKLSCMTSREQSRHPRVPDVDVLFVDLDGTLISSDCTYESLAVAAGRQPFATLKTILSTLPRQDLPAMKQRLADIAPPDPNTLPWLESSIRYLKLCQSRGVRLVLATASNMQLVRPLAHHLGLFEDVIATSAQGPNLKGQAKLHVMRQWCVEHGAARFGYMGDSKADIPIFNAADASVKVSHRPNGPAHTEQFTQIFYAGLDRSRDLWRLMRPHHWIKNTLVFVPMLTSHRWGESAVVLDAVLAFIAMSLAASFVYVTNDLIDVDSDRHHPDKRLRPIAGGRVRAPTAMRLMLILLGVVTVLSVLTLPLSAVFMILGYLLISLAYSTYLKRVALADVVTIGVLHLWRILVGGEATGIGVSGWLLGFAACLFLSIACAKRYAEIRHGKTTLNGRIIGRGWRSQHGRTVGWFGAIASGFSVLILAKYVHSSAAKALYAQPGWLWAGCAVLGFWLVRMWWLTRKGRMHDDPLIFAIRDPGFWLTLVLFAATVLLAM